MKKIHFVTALMFAPSIAWAGDKEACIASHEQGQIAMLQRKFRVAQAAFQSCMRAECPSAIKQDCTELMSKVDAGLPSIVVSVVDAEGSAITSAKVIVDDEEISDHVGDATVVDPGKHLLRVLTPDGAEAEQSIIVVIGEKEKAIQLTLPPRVIVPPPSSIVPPPPTAPPRPLEAKRPSRPTQIALGVSALGAASFATFGIWGKASEHSLDSCKPYCTSSQVNPTYTRFTIADVSLATGIVALGVATVLWLTGTHAEPSMASLHSIAISF